MTLASLQLFLENLDNLQAFLGKWFNPPPLAENSPYVYERIS